MSPGKSAIDYLLAKCYKTVAVLIGVKLYLTYQQRRTGEMRKGAEISSM